MCSSRKFNHGHVVRVEVPDPDGGNEKVRPAIVLDFNSSGELLLLVCATTSFEPGNLQPDEIKLPFGNLQSPSRTGLTKPCVAKCEWLVTFAAEDVIEQLGAVPDKLNLAILQRVRDLRSARDADENSQRE